METVTLTTHARRSLLPPSPPQCLTKNPKSYPSWFHRKWSFLHFPTSPISSEITLTTTFLKLDSRNFHCWNYRRFLISQQIGVDSATGEIKDLLIKSGEEL